MKLASPSCFLASSQVGVFWRTVITPDRVSSTKAGGLAYACTLGNDAVVAAVSLLREQCQAHISVESKISSYFEMAPSCPGKYSLKAADCVQTLLNFEPSQQLCGDLQRQEGVAVRPNETATSLCTPLHSLFCFVVLYLRDRYVLWPTLSSDMSFLVRTLRASSAACRAGRALSRPAWHSEAMALASSASSPILMASAFTCQHCRDVLLFAFMRPYGFACHRVCTRDVSLKKATQQCKSTLEQMYTCASLLGTCSM